MKALYQSLLKRKVSLNFKLFLSFILILSITFFATGYFSYQYNLQISEHEIGEQFSQNVEQLQARLTLRLQEIYRISSYINFEPYVMKALQESDRTIRYQDQVQLQRLLNQVMIDTPHILTAFLYDMDGNEHRPPSSFLHSDLNKEIYERILQSTEQSDGELVWMRLPYFQYYEDDRKNEIVVAARKLKNTELKTFGTMILLLHDRIFENELKNSIKGDKANVYLFDNQNHLIYTDDPSEEVHSRLLSQKNGSEVKVIEGDTYIFAQSYSEQTGFTLVSRISTKALHEKSKVIFNVAILNGVISIFLAGGLLLFANRKLLRPLKQLVAGMKRVRNGQLNTRITVHTNDELSFIGESFNSMIDEVNRLIKEVYERQLLQSEAELAALQAQLNPHFLYNTLDMIHGRLYMQGDVDSADIIIALSRMLRYALESSSSSTTLEREMEQLSHYLMIQQYRFEDELDIQIDIDDALLDCEITRLLLQPIVENAFMHAYQDRHVNKRLMIRAFRQAEFLIIEVEDNGGGMDQELVHRINHSKSIREHDATSQGSSRIGMFNVIRRIEMIYGNGHRLEVKSDKGIGTTISLYLPYRKHKALESSDIE